MAPNAGMPRLIMPYTTLSVKGWLEITTTASALNALTMRYVSFTRSGLPC